MNYNKIISFVYALLAVGYGTYFCIMYIYYYMATINGYNSRIKTIGTIKNIECYDKASCYANIEYTVNNIKYTKYTDVPNNLKIGDKIYVDYEFVFYVTEQHIIAETILNKKIEELKNGNNN